METFNRGSLTPLQQKILIGVTLLVLASIYFLRSIYIPIFISYFLAFLLNPIVRWLENRGFGRVGPIFLILLLVFALIIAFSVMMVPKIVVQLQQLFQRLPLLVDFLSERLGPISLRYLGYDVFSQWKDVLPTMIPEAAVYPAVSLLESVLSGTVKALTMVLTVLMIPILTFYILKDYYILNERLLQMVPRRYLTDVREVFRRLSIVLGGLIRGQFLVCAILAAYFSVALSAVGMEMALLLGILSGLMNLVPFVGPLVSLALALFLAVLGGAQITQCMAILGVYLVANLVDNTVLTPRIVGKQMGISPLTIILALLAGGELLGFLGILLALPVTAMVKVLGGYLQERYFASSYYKEEAPIEGKQSLSEIL
jgi:phosphoribosylaminoimidazole-succinocarboxamide synthase